MRGMPDDRSFAASAAECSEVVCKSCQCGLDLIRREIGGEDEFNIRFSRRRDRDLPWFAFTILFSMAFGWFKLVG